MGIGAWIKFYGAQRPHSALAGLTPDRPTRALRDFPQTRQKNTKSSNDRNWRLDSNRAKLNPAAG
jgi:hypothetical protein